MSEANKPAFGGSYGQVLIKTTGRNAPQTVEYRHSDLTKREYTATCVLSAIIQSATNDATRYMNRASNGFPVDRSGYVKTALQYADAMLAETERQNDLLALVEQVATLRDGGQHIDPDVADDLINEARRILGRSD